MYVAYLWLNGGYGYYRILILAPTGASPSGTKFRKWPLSASLGWNHQYVHRVHCQMLALENYSRI
eukprot:scaffold176689_cov39-Prasinocladus_malaysianus.AAC.2